MFHPSNRRTDFHYSGAVYDEGLGVQHDAPEISYADLSALLLQCLDWGVDAPADLPWLDPPPAGALAAARDLLELLRRELCGAQMAAGSR